MTKLDISRSTRFLLLPFLFLIALPGTWIAPGTGAAAAQEQSFSAGDLVRRAVDKWEGGGAWEYSLRTVLDSGGEQVIFTGNSVVLGTASRTRLFTPGELEFVLVKNGEVCWTVIRPSGSTGARNIFKSPRDLYLSAVHPLTRMVSTSTSVHDPLDPGTILAVLEECYDLEYGGTTARNGVPTHVVDGVLKRSIAARKTMGAGREDSTLRPAEIRKVRLLLSKEDLLPSRLDLFESSPYKATCSFFFSRIASGITVNEEIFQYDPPEGTAVHDLGERYRKAASRAAAEASALAVKGRGALPSAEEILERAREKWSSLSNVGFNFTFSIFTEGIPVEFAGKLFVQGELGRFESGMEIMDLHTVMVNDGRFFWTEIRSPFNTDGPVVYKRNVEKLKEKQPDFQEGINSFLQNPTGVPDPIELIEIFTGGLKMEYEGTTEWEGHRVHLLAGESSSKNGSAEETSSINHIRIFFHEESMILAGLEICDKESEGLTGSLVLSDLKTNWRIPDGTFRYEPPEEATVFDVDEERKKALRIPASVDRPALPISRKSCFDRVSEDKRLDLILSEDGSILGYKSSSLSADFLSNTPMKHNVEKFSDTAALLPLFTYAGDLFGTTTERVGGRSFEYTDVDLVIHASPAVPCHILQEVLEYGRSYGSSIRRIHFAVQDRETGEEGLLTLHLPHCIGIRGSHKDPRNLSNWYRVHFKATLAGPEYALSDASNDEEQWAFDSLGALEKAIDAVKKANKRAGFVLWLDSPLESNPRITMEDFIDLLTLLVSRGVDLKWEEYGYICIYPGRIEQGPEPLEAAREFVLPLSDQAAFGKVSDGPILEVVFGSDGTVTVSGKKYEGSEGYRRLLYFFTKKEERDYSGSSKVNVFFRAPKDLPLRHIFQFIVQGGASDVMIYRIYLAVRDGETDKEGIIPFFLPHDVGVNSLTMDREMLSHLHQIVFTGYPNRPHFELSRVLSDDAGESFYSLRDLENRIDSLKTGNPKAEFTFALGSFPVEADPPGTASATVKDLADLLTSLSVRGVDLEAKKSSFYIEDEIIEDG